MSQDEITDLKQFIAQQTTDIKQEVKQEVKRLDARIDRLEASMERRLNYLTARVAALEFTVTNGFSGIADIFEAIHARSDAIENIVKSHGQRLLKIEQSL